MSDERDKWVFDVQIVGRGITEEQAWYEAKLNFCEDPVGPNKVTHVPFDPWQKWHKGGKFNIREIRAHIREIAAKHETLRAFRIVQMEDSTDNGIMQIHDIWQFEALLAINKKYPYRGYLDSIAQAVEGKFILIEEIEKTDWEHDR